MDQRPSRDDTSMALARVMSYRSTCTRKQVGVVMSLDGRVLATGYNGAPAGMPHCDHTCTCHNTPEAVELGVHCTGCPADANTGCEVTVHAEANAIAFAAKHGVALGGCDLFTTLSPCLACAKLIVNAGVKRVFCEEMYRDSSGTDFLEIAGIEILAKNF